MSKLQVVVGGQFGSEAKGHVAGWLAAREPSLMAIRVAGPNAGHSVVHPETGAKYPLRQVPVAAVTNPNAQLAIAAGSEVDPVVLEAEIAMLEADGIKVRDRLLIDPNATWLTDAHIAQEATLGLRDSIGSTGKGIGAARAARAMRTARTVGDAILRFVDYGEVGRVADQALNLASLGSTIQIEGTQGYGLGLHTPYYPKVTSSDCTALDFLAMAQISPWAQPFQGDDGELEVWVCFRPYPIRVAGPSGPLWLETTWEELGLPPEYTTVTHKMRRVGHWDQDLATRAVAANGGERDDGPVRIALTMADQIDPALAGVTDRDTLLASYPLRRFGSRVNLPIHLATTSDRTAVDLRS